MVNVKPSFYSNFSAYQKHLGHKNIVNYFSKRNFMILRAFDSGPNNYVMMSWWYRKINSYYLVSLFITIECEWLLLFPGFSFRDKATKRDRIDILHVPFFFRRRNEKESEFTRQQSVIHNNTKVFWYCF